MVTKNGNGVANRDLDELVANEEIAQIVNTMMLSRESLWKEAFEARRNINHECGLPDDPIPYTAYDDQYKRNPYAARAIAAMARESWQPDPEITDDLDTSSFTDFDEALLKLSQSLGEEAESYFEPQEEEGNPLWNWFEELDEKAGIGRYGVMLLGFDDVKSVDGLRQPVKRAKTINYLRVFPEGLAPIAEYETDPKSRRFNRPLSYDLSFVDNRDLPTASPLVASAQVYGGQINTVRVHHSRVLHFCESGITFHTPRLQQVFNNILGIHKILCGDPEAYWKMGFPLWVVESDPKLAGVRPKGGIGRIRDNIEQVLNSLQKVGVLSGYSLKSIAPTLADPTVHINVQVEAVSVKMEIPKRILLGSEQGVLAASEDSKRWEARKRKRRKRILTPRMLVPFTDRLIGVGILPTPKQYYATWPTDESLTDVEKMDIFTRKMTGLSTAVSGGVNQILTDKRILMEAGYTEDDAATVLDEVQLEHETEMEERQAMADEQGFLPQAPEGFEKPQLELEEEEVKTGNAELSGGQWVTIQGTHVYLKGGKIVAGPKDTIGKSPDELPDRHESQKEPKSSKHTAHAATGSEAKEIASKHADKVAEKLSREEKAAIEDYAVDGYIDLNKAMRSCAPDFGCLKGKTKEMHDRIESALEKAGKLPSPILVHRGLSFKYNDAPALISQAESISKSGKPYAMPSITSTTTNAQKAADFGKGVTFAITAKSGLLTNRWNEYGEDELIQSSKVRYKISRVERKGDGATIHLEEL